MILKNYLSEKEFNVAKSEYEKWQATCKRSLIFHVGTCAGLYSELNALHFAVIYCYVNNIRFELYADDANFSNSGWEDFFVPFCKLNHNPLNRKYNYRAKWYYRCWRFVFPNILLRRFYYPYLLKSQENVQYLMQDVFFKCYSKKFVESKFTWKVFNIENQEVQKKFTLLRSFVMRYNKQTKSEIEQIIRQLDLPSSYCSVQIRGGDKTLEFNELIKVEEYVKELQLHMVDSNSLFVFTDDYQNVKRLKELKPEWNIYTLTQPSECGYYNDKFQSLAWEVKRKNLVKLFAIMEICFNSAFHVGCGQSCANDFIRSVKDEGTFLELKSCNEKEYGGGVKNWFKRYFLYN